MQKHLKKLENWLENGDFCPLSCSISELEDEIDKQKGLMQFGYYAGILHARSVIAVVVGNGSISQ